MAEELGARESRSYVSPLVVESKEQLVGCDKRGDWFEHPQGVVIEGCH